MIEIGSELRLMGSVSPKVMFRTTLVSFECCSAWTVWPAILLNCVPNVAGLCLCVHFKARIWKCCSRRSPLCQKHTCCENCRVNLSKTGFRGRFGNLIFISVFKMQTTTLVKIKKKTIIKPSSGVEGMVSFERKTCRTRFLSNAIPSRNHLTDLKEFVTIVKWESMCRFLVYIYIPFILKADDLLC